MNTIIQNIDRQWDPEASNEPDDIYFYSPSYIDKLFDGRCYYVIGRKGTGKTAISRYIELHSNRVNGSFSEKLSFKNFPFNLLYESGDCAFTPQHQYITLWTQLIYMNVCKMFIKNPNIDKKIVSRLQQCFPCYLGGKLEDEVKQMKDKNFTLNLNATIAGTGGGFEFGRGATTNSIEPSWTDNISILETIIKDNCDKSKYYIVFDELDEDYTNVSDGNCWNSYIPLLTGLFKAVQKVRSEMRELQIFPIIFLRDDIYDLIKDNDKNKWKSKTITLQWEKDSLKAMFAHRISVDSQEMGLNFKNAWGKIANPFQMPYGSLKKKMIEPFDYILEKSLLRPRDIVTYTKYCSDLLVKNNSDSITEDTIKQAEKEYSKALKDEFSDELRGLVPNIEIVWSILTQIRKQIFSYQDFEPWFKYREMYFADIGCIKLLEILFDFSIIGNQDRANKAKFYFKYKDSDLEMSTNVNFVVNGGLLKALKIS